MKPNAMVEQRIIRKNIKGVASMLNEGKSDIEIIKFMRANDPDLDYVTARAILDRIKIEREVSE